MRAPAAQGGVDRRAACPARRPRGRWSRRCVKRCAAGTSVSTNCVGVAAAGAFSRPSMAKVRSCRARWIIMKPPPPMPENCGSTTLSTNWIAAAASIALPPRRSTSAPACAASGCDTDDHAVLERRAVPWGRRRDSLAGGRKDDAGRRAGRVRGRTGGPRRRRVAPAASKGQREAQEQPRQAGSTGLMLSPLGRWSTRIGPARMMRARGCRGSQDGNRCRPRSAITPSSRRIGIPGHDLCPRRSVLQLRIPVGAAAAGREVEHRPERRDVGRIARVLAGVGHLPASSRWPRTAAPVSPSRRNTMSAGYSLPSGIRMPRSFA